MEEDTILTNEKTILLEKKARAYFNMEKAVHITLKKNNTWENGWILETPESDFFKLTYFPEIQKKRGKDSDYFFYLELLDISEYDDLNKKEKS